MKTKLKTKNVPFLDSYRNKSPRSYEFVFLFNTPEYFLLVRVWLHFLFSACPPWAPYCCAPHFVSCCTHLLRHLSLTRVTKSYLLALGTTQISSYFTKHWTKFLTHQTGNYPVTCFSVAVRTSSENLCQSGVRVPLSTRLRHVKDARRWFMSQVLQKYRTHTACPEDRWVLFFFFFSILQRWTGKNKA